MVRRPRGVERLEVTVLGGLSVVGGGTERALSRKNKAVLAALALAGAEGLARHRLADLFWGTSGEEQARASLRQALATIRRGLGPAGELLRADAERAWLAADGVQVDALVFERLAETGDPGAIGLYTGDLLDGFLIKEEGFEAWWRPLRERLRAKAIALLHAALEQAGDAAGLAEPASRLLALEPASEPAHRALMRSYAAQGREDAALRQYQACREVLARELGVEPDSETIALHDAIKGRRFRAARGKIDHPEAAAIAGGHKPAISVRPFANLSDDPGQDYFASGMQLDIVAALLRHRWLTVISPANMLRDGLYSMVVDRQVVEAGVDYLLTGSVRKAGDRLRIGAQLVDAGSGEHVWSEHYDRQAGDLFLIQDDIVARIASHIDMEVGARERQRATRRPTGNMNAWDCYHAGMMHYLRFSQPDHSQALGLFSRSLEFDADFGEGHAWWSYINVLSTYYFDTQPTQRLFDRALEAARRAVAIDDQNAMFRMLVARAHLARQEYAEGLRELDIALDLNPNLAGVYCARGDALSYEGQYDQALEQFEQALQLGPRDPIRWAYLSYGALAHLFAEDFTAALDWAEKANRYPHCQFWAEAHAVVALAQLGRLEEARKAGEALRARKPGFSRSFAREKFYFIKRPEQLRVYLDGLAKAGIPD